MGSTSQRCHGTHDTSDSAGRHVNTARTHAPRRTAYPVALSPDEPSLEPPHVRVDRAPDEALQRVEHVRAQEELGRA